MGSFPPKTFASLHHWPAALCWLQAAPLACFGQGGRDDEDGQSRKARNKERESIKERGRSRDESKKEKEAAAAGASLIASVLLRPQAMCACHHRAGVLRKRRILVSASTLGKSEGTIQDSSRKATYVARDAVTECRMFVAFVSKCVVYSYVHSSIHHTSECARRS